MQRDIHCVLRIEATLPPPTPPTTSQPAADGGSQDAGGSPPAQPAADTPAPLDPATLALSLKFTPWVGQEIAVDPALLAPLGEVSPTRASTPANDKAGGKGAAKGAPSPVPAEASTRQPAGPRWWCAVRHFKLTADEALVRAMAQSNGVLQLPISLAQPPPEPAPKAAKGQPTPPEPVSVSFNTTIPLVCAGLLLGETQVESHWPSKLQPLPPDLSQICSSLKISLTCLSMPEISPEEEAAAKAAAAKPAKGGKGGKDAAGAATDIDLSALPGEPVPLLTPALASRLNPLVIMPLRAKHLPDSPATVKLLDTRCEPVKLRVAWPPAGSVPSEQVGRSGQWTTLEPLNRGGPGLNYRDVGFAQPLVMLAGDMQFDQLMRWCKESPVTLEVHDRTVIPEPPEFPIKQTENSETQPDDDGYVCAIARIPLLDLVRGRSTVRFRVPLAPYTTIRGAASLDWGRRPGTYAASAAVIKGWVRCAVPLTQMEGISPVERVFSRAVFTMDYRDSDLFHLLEDTIRQQNAWALGLAAPQPRHPQPPASPTDTHTRRKSQGSAISSGRNSRNSTPSRGGHSDSEGGALRRAETSHSTHSVGRHGRSSKAGTSTNVPAAEASRGSTTRRSQIRISDPAAAHHGSSPAFTPLQLPAAMQRTSSLGAGGARVSLWSAPQSTTGGGGKGPDKKELRFHDFTGADNDSGGSDYESDAESHTSPAEVALKTALEQLETIKLDTRLTQTLSTFRLTPEQCSDTSIDLLTGWHLVDGRERVIAVEGRSQGAMQVIQAIIAWALEDQRPEEGWLPRTVLHNTTLQYPVRLWAELGVDLHIVKLHAPLNKIVADASSYATGKVRVDCIAGLKRLSALRAAPWARLADDLGLYPTPHMLHLVDKKFGGELTKADVFGVEAQEYMEDEEDGGGMGLVREGDDARSSHSSSKRSAKSLRSKRTLRSKRSKDRRPQRRRPALQPLDRHNDAYLAMREQARAERIATDWHKNNLEHIASLTATAATIRAEWATWNPQREAARKLEEAFKKGTYNPQDTVTSRRSLVASGCVPEEEARTRGWVAHTAAFKWPAPKDPGSYARHPHQVSAFRQEQLAEPWEESTATNTFLQPLDGPLSTGPNFITTVKNATGLFGQDPEYWKTVHLSGASREKEEIARKAKEKADWAGKLVADATLRLTFPVRPAVTQLDRTQHILLDPPKKRGFKVAYVPQAPYSMHLAEPWTESKISAGMRAKEDPQTFIKPNEPFKRHLGLVKSCVAKAGHENLQSWTAAIHDPRYQET